MNPRTPPRVAVLLLKWFGVAKDEALAGDLLEEFDCGRSSSWFWRQTGSVILISVGRVLRSSRRALLPFLLGSLTESALDLSVPQLFHVPTRFRIAGIESIVFAAIALVMYADLHIRMRFLAHRFLRRRLEARLTYLAWFAVFILADLTAISASSRFIRLAESALVGWLASWAQPHVSAGVWRMVGGQNTEEER